MTNDMQKTEEPVSKFRTYFPFFVQVVGIIVVLLNLWLVSKLAPIEQNTSIMAQEISEIKDRVVNIEGQHNGFVSKDTFNGLVTRIDHISNRVDAIYSKLVK